MPEQKYDISQAEIDDEERELEEERYERNWKEDQRRDYQERLHR